ncbi:RecQ family ATP-dependent DNA helicase [Treponema pedis]|uniref:RecQ family ATP-dependent DNA helicase n=1 Tax=Treponema pedis TaxID=409322 RepID=UPI00041648C1|nr:RecQ family ATP-dependent DNA helicase [Treponema pedis]
MNDNLNEKEYNLTAYKENISDTPEDMDCPYIYETDNPVYGADGAKDIIAVCAANVFGIPSLFPWQRLVIANILDAVHAAEAVIEITENKQKNRADIIAEITENKEEETLTDIYDEDGVMRGRQIILLPTGAGKSLCFQVPALLLDGPTVIIYPLLALMSDQFRRMCEGGLEPVLFRGGQNTEERKAQLARMEGTDGKPPAKLIIANPEVLLSGGLIERIAARKVSHLAIDEAHCVTEWGDSFRPAYLQLTEIIKKLNPPAVTAFTATASPDVLKRISEILFEGRAHLVRGESDRPNIIYFVKHCRIKMPALLEEVEKRKKPMVIFCSSRKSTEQTASYLRLYFNDENIRFYHAGLQREEKTEVEQWFHIHNSAILVTTCAWGMGVDKKDVKTVIHKDPPPTAEAYIQEAGRGGRDGSIAEAVLLWSNEDKKRISLMPEKQRLRASVLEEFAASGKCRREVLLKALGEERAVAKTKDDEVITCSGCDICFKTAIQYAEDEALFIDFIKRNKRIFNQTEAAAVFSKNLRFWKAGDVKRLSDELLSCGLIKKYKTFLWKDKLDTVK